MNRNKIFHDLGFQYAKSMRTKLKSKTQLLMAIYEAFLEL